ncbi:MAG: hypothetical protein HYW88_01540 [Candidatus Sungbacteria bacterium]|nr:hypothetical protein [Candidatus Sungbacteria bacterium]
MPIKTKKKSKNLKILLIEDDEFMIKILEREFKANGLINTRFVRDGESQTTEPTSTGNRP